MKLLESRDIDLTILHFLLRALYNAECYIVIDQIVFFFREFISDMKPYQAMKVLLYAPRLFYRFITANNQLFENCTDHQHLSTATCPTRKPTK